MMKKPSHYLVLCRADRKAPSRDALVLPGATRAQGEPGDYELATRTEFGHEWQAQEYADGISASREPVVVMVVGRRS